MFKALFSNLRKKLVADHLVVYEIDILNVNKFNEWFCNKDNNAVYAHEGIFLRLDKLSLSHIDDYLLKAHKLEKHDFEYDKLQDFLDSIKKDWKEKIFLKNK